MTRVRMRSDLAFMSYQVPAYFTGKDDSGYVMLSSDALWGATLLPDTGDEDEYNYNRVLLKDGRIVFIVGVDLDFEEMV